MKIRAVAIGTLTDIACTHLFTLALAIMLLDPGSGSQAAIERINPTLLDSVMLVWGLFFTGLGGFVAGRLAPLAPEVHGALVGVSSLLVSHLCFGWSPENVGMLVYGAGTGLSLVLPILGGRLARAWPNHR